MTEVERVNLYCPFCGEKGVFEQTVDMPFPLWAERVSKLQSFECKLCGGVFFKEAFVLTLLMSGAS